MHEGGHGAAGVSHSSCPRCPPSPPSFLSPTCVSVPPESRAASPSLLFSSPSSSSSSFPSPSASPPFSRPVAASACASSSSLIFGPGVPVLLEEVDAIVQQQHDSSSGNGSRRESKGSSSTFKHSSWSSSSATTTTAARSSSSNPTATSSRTSSCASRISSSSSSRTPTRAFPLSSLSSSAFSPSSFSPSSSSSCCCQPPAGASAASGSNSGSSTSSSPWSTSKDERSNSCARWTSLPPPRLAASFSVRVCGHAHAFLESVDCFLLRGTFDAGAALLVDVSWLSPEVTRSARESVAAAATAALAFPRSSRSSDDAGDEEGLLRHLPLLQFIGEVRPVAVRHLNAENRLLLLYPFQRASSSSQHLSCDTPSNACFGSGTRRSSSSSDALCKSNSNSRMGAPSSNSYSSTTRRALSSIRSSGVGAATSNIQREASRGCFSRCGGSRSFVASESCGRRVCRDSNNSESCNSSGSRTVRLRQLYLRRRRCCRARGEGLLGLSSQQQQQEQERQQGHVQQQEQCPSWQRARASERTVDSIPQALEEAAWRGEAAARARTAERRKARNEEQSEGEFEDEDDEIEDTDDEGGDERDKGEGHENEASTSLQGNSPASATWEGSGSGGDNMKGEREVIGLLRARVCRQVTGMNMHVYVESLRLFRLVQQQQQAEQQSVYQEKEPRGKYGRQEEVFSAEARRKRENWRAEEVLQQLHLWGQLQQQPRQQEDEPFLFEEHERMVEGRLSEPGPWKQQGRQALQQEEEQQEAVALSEKKRRREEDEEQVQVGSIEQTYDEELSSIEVTQRLVSS